MEILFNFNISNFNLSSDFILNLVIILFSMGIIYIFFSKASLNYRKVEKQIQEENELYTEIILGLESASQNVSRPESIKRELRIAIWELYSLLKLQPHKENKSVVLHRKMLEKKRDISHDLENAKVNLEVIPFLGILGTLLGFAIPYLFNSSNTTKQSFNVTGLGFFLAATSTIFALLAVVYLKKKYEANIMAKFEYFLHQQESLEKIMVQCDGFSILEVWLNKWPDFVPDENKKTRYSEVDQFMRHANINLTSLIDVLFIILFLILSQNSEKIKQEIKQDEKERTILSGKIKTSEIKMSDLNKSIEELINEKHILLEKNENLKKLLKDEKEKLAKLDSVYKDLDNSFLAIQTRWTMLQKNIRKKEKHNEKLINAWKNSYNDISKRFVDLKDKMKLLKVEIENSKKSKDQILKQLEDIKKANKQLEEKKKKLVSEKQFLAKEIETIKAELLKKEKELLEEIKKKKLMREKLTKEKEKLLKRLHKLSELKNNLNKEIKVLQGEITTHKKQIKKLEKQTENLRKELKEKTETLSKKEVLINKMKARIETDAKLIKRLEVQIKEGAKKIQEQKLRIDEDLKLIEEQKKKIKLSEKQISEQKDKIVQQETLRILLERKFQQIQEQYQQMQEDFDKKNIHKTYLKSRILQENFKVYEIIIKGLKDDKRAGISIVYPDGKKTNTKLVKNKKEISEFFKEKIPVSIRYDASQTAFLVLVEPGAKILYERFVKEILEGMKVIYGTQHLDDDSWRNH